MTKKLPIWLTDSDGHQFHVKEDSRGDHYVVSRRFVNKLIYLPDGVKEAEVGQSFTMSWVLYGDPEPELLTVERNDLRRT